jgi:hypothetical protein
MISTEVRFWWESSRVILLLSTPFPQICSLISGKISLRDDAWDKYFIL